MHQHFGACKYVPHSEAGVGFIPFKCNHCDGVAQDSKQWFSDASVPKVRCFHGTHWETATSIMSGHVHHEQWAAHAAYNAARGWPPPCAEEACLQQMRSARFVDAYAALERRPGEWRAPPWSAHTRDPERPPYRIDFVWSRAPDNGRCLVPLSAYVIREAGEASDHLPLIVDFEAIAFDAGE